MRACGTPRPQAATSLVVQSLDAATIAAILGEEAGGAGGSPGVEFGGALAPAPMPAPTQQGVDAHERARARPA